MTPEVSIYVRHSPKCKYSSEVERRCKCRKHLRWTANGKRMRRPANTRVWDVAETARKALEDQLAGRVASDTTKTLDEAVKMFIKEKRLSVSDDVLAKYTRELARLEWFCANRKSVFVVQGLTKELLIEYAETWEAQYPSTQTRAQVKTRLRGFLKWCYESQWLPRIPSLPKIRVDEPPTLPLSPEEYDRLLASIPKAFDNVPARGPAAEATRNKPKRIRALTRLMRHTGLAIVDAVKLPKSLLRFSARGVYRVVTNRQKTGTDVEVPIPLDLALELLEVGALYPDRKHFFWTGEGVPRTAVSHYQRDYRKLFAVAEIEDGGMKAHRLRDTFAVSMLENGVPLEDVSKMLGHESIKTTERHYAKWVKGRQDRLDNLVIGTWG